MREMILTNKDLLIEMEEIRKRISGHDEKIEMIFDYLKRFVEEQKKPKNKLGYKSDK
jgi:hypothetical protein